MWKLYTLPQWILIFFLYCFVGWVWECCYVSCLKKKWVNRGFLHGPFLPIYGSGMVLVLFLTAPIRENIFLIFLVGMIGATILEYVTGACMERLFHVRYWDYSKQPFNLNGHICLAVSLGWGVGSVLFVRYVHRPVDHIIHMVPEIAAEVLSLLLVIWFAVDLTQSFNEAMDLRSTLAKITKEHEQIRMLEKRIDVMMAFGEDTYHRYLKQLGESTISTKNRFLDNVRKMNEIKNQKLQEMETQIHNYFQEHEKEQQEENRYMAIFEEIKHRMSSGSEREYRRLSRILKRNPDAISLRYKEALKEIKEMMENRK